MMKFKKCYAMLFAIVLMLQGQVFFAQIAAKNLRFYIGNEASTLPSWRLVRTPIHPSFGIGADWRTKNKTHWQSALGTDFSYYYQARTEHALMLDATYRKGYRFGFGLQPNFFFAIGYKHSIIPGNVYRLENGVYEKTKHWGKAQFNTKIGFGLQYHLNEKLSITSDYRAMAAYPTNGKYFPFSLHNLFSIGVCKNL